MQVFFQGSVLCRNADQMKIRLITLEGKSSERKRQEPRAVAQERHRQRKKLNGSLRQSSLVLSN